MALCPPAAPAPTGAAASSALMMAGEPCAPSHSQPDKSKYLRTLPRCLLQQNDTTRLCPYAMCDMAWQGMTLSAYLRAERRGQQPRV